MSRREGAFVEEPPETLEQIDIDLRDAKKAYKHQNVHGTVESVAEAQQQLDMIEKHKFEAKAERRVAERRERLKDLVGEELERSLTDAERAAGKELMKESSASGSSSVARYANMFEQKLAADKMVADVLKLTDKDRAREEIKQSIALFRQVGQEGGGKRKRVKRKVMTRKRKTGNKRRGRRTVGRRRTRSRAHRSKARRSRAHRKQSA